MTMASPAAVGRSGEAPLIEGIGLVQEFGGLKADQVKRLEELVEAPMFKKGRHFELSGVGEVCFDYGKRVLRLHDDMLDEVGSSNKPNGALRIGVPSEFASVLAPRLAQFSADAEIPAAFEVTVES